MCEGVDPMGRGRAKAKQTKVARKLKYQALDTDLGALQRELAGAEGDPLASVADDSDDSDDSDDYAFDDDYDEAADHRF
jgi:hypothetical protein